MLQFTWDSNCGPPISVDGMVVHTVEAIWIAMGCRFGKLLYGSRGVCASSKDFAC